MSLMELLVVACAGLPVVVVVAAAEASGELAGAQAANTRTTAA
jgi:hypothetical protein